LLVKPLEQLRDRRLVLPFAVIEQHVAPEVRIATQNLVRSLAHNHHFVTRVPYRAAQQVLRHSVRVHAQRLCLRNRIRKVIRAELLFILFVPPRCLVVLFRRVVEVPVLVHLHMLFRRQQKCTGGIWNIPSQSVRPMCPHRNHRVVHAVLVPACRPPRRP